jgi:hypothetical protein
VLSAIQILLEFQVTGTWNVSTTLTFVGLVQEKDIRRTMLPSFA